jgi:hypothetical protein
MDYAYFILLALVAWSWLMNSPKKGEKKKEKDMVDQSGGSSKQTDLGDMVDHQASNSIGYPRCMCTC